MKKLFCAMVVAGLAVAPLAGCGDKKEKDTTVKEAAKVNEKAEVKKETATVEKETAEKK